MCDRAVKISPIANYQATYVAGPFDAASDLFCSTLFYESLLAPEKSVVYSRKRGAGNLQSRRRTSTRTSIAWPLPLASDCSQTPNWRRRDIRCMVALGGNGYFFFTFLSNSGDELASLSLRSALLWMGGNAKAFTTSPQTRR
jgi:hypothetical protein